MEKVTVLVAVYNTQEYLADCLQSLLRQTLKDIQIVCVDDASTDSSLEILNAYAGQDARIEVIHLPENQGQAHARNVALSHARGEFICFLDSDDWLSDDALEQTVSVFESNPMTDSVLFRLTYCDAEGNSVSCYPMPAAEVYSGYEAFKASLTWKIHGVYMVRAHIHKTFPYDESARSYSDDNTTRLHYLNSREVRCSQGTYFYRQHAQSVTHQVSMKRFDYLKANASMKRQLMECGSSDEVLSIYENERWLNCIGLYGFYFKYRHQLEPSERATGLSLLKETWQNIETERLTWRNCYKFGYIPFRGCWQLFRMQEEIYFSLREIKKCLKNDG